MDGQQFDRLARLTSGQAGRGTRRAWLAATLGAALGIIGGAGNVAEAKRRCKKTYRRCSGNGQCCSKACCPSVFGGRQCFPKDARCCTAGQGGGACPRQGRCCGPRLPNFPDGSCCPKQAPNCCPAPLAGCCPPGRPQCFAPTTMRPEGTCCPAGAVYCDQFGCCAPGGRVAAAAGVAPTKPEPATGVDAGAAGDQ